MIEEGINNNQEQLSSNTGQLNNQENKQFGNTEQFDNTIINNNEIKKEENKEDNNIEEINKETKEEKENKQTNLFDYNKQEQKDINDFIDFNKEEEFKEYEDIFKNSKISKEEYNKFKEKILKSTSPEEFTKELIEDYGENYKKEIELFRETTKDMYPEDIKRKIETYPAEIKSLLLATVNKMARDMETLKKEYGVQTTTLSTTEGNKNIAKEEFEKLTLQLVNNDYKPEQYENIIKRRVELANIM